MRRLTLTRNGLDIDLPSKMEGSWKGVGSLFLRISAPLEGLEGKSSCSAHGKKKGIAEKSIFLCGSYTLFPSIPSKCHLE
jgi:hypothetical protein